MLTVPTHSGSLVSGPSLVSGGNGKRRPRRYHCMNDVSVYLGKTEGRGQRAEEVRHSHVRYALMNIPRTKNHQYNNRKRCVAKIMMGLGGVL